MTTTTGGVAMTARMRRIDADLRATRGCGLREYLLRRLGQGAAVAQVASEIGVAWSTLYGWRHMLRIGLRRAPAVVDLLATDQLAAADAAIAAAEQAA